MIYDVASLPDDPDQLKSIIITLSQANDRQQETLDRQKKTLDQLVAEVSKLNVTIEQLLEMIFGKKSEKQSKEKANDESKDKPSSDETSENTDGVRSVMKAIRITSTSFGATVRGRASKAS